MLCRPLTLFLCVAIGIPGASTLHFPTNDDLRHMGAIADPRLSPDGRQVLVRITASAADSAKSDLWLIDIPTNTPVLLFSQE